MTFNWSDIQRHLGIVADGIPGPATREAVARALGMIEPDHMLHDSKAFFDGVRKVTGALDAGQVEIINMLIGRAAHWPGGWLAYALATAWHESRLRPIEEWGHGNGHKYGRKDETGKAPFGRGLVQLTHRPNYETMDKALDLGGTLAADYDRALEPDIAVRVLVIGMERGLFTGKSLGSYIEPGPGTHEEFVDARRIINGTDRAEMIADYADLFRQALIDGGW